MGKRVIFCQTEQKPINEIHSIKKHQNIYPAVLLKEQSPIEPKYKFRDIKDIAENKCPHCGGNLSFYHEDL